ncbi:MAG: hypothetical protein WC378_00065 [Opitutaceae bacterium]|jgi:hypothetical protein
MAFSIDHARRMYAERGPVGFIHSMHSLLGLRNEKGIKYRNAEGRPVLESQTIRPEGVSLKALATAIFGEQNIERRLSSPAPKFQELEGDVLEAGNDIVPSTFSDITAFNETVAGLLEVKILEAYNRPEFLADRLCTNIPSNKVQEKFIGVSTPGDYAQERKPGQSHPRAALTERYVTSPITKNRANAVDVTREAVMFDLTRQVLEHAELVSQTLALRKEYLVLDTVLGIRNTYTYDGTNYKTFLISGNWVNLVNNDLVDYTSLDKVYQLLSRMVDQETGQPISIECRDLLVMPGRRAICEKLLSDTQVRQGDESATTTVGTPLGYGKNPIAGRFNEPMVSQYAYKRIIDVASDSTIQGLLKYIDVQQSLSYYSGTTLLAAGAAAADTIWYSGDFKKAFFYVENMPLTVVRAAPTSYEMADRGLVFSMFIDEMGMPGIKDPRYVIRNQGFAAATPTWTDPY